MLLPYACGPVYRFPAPVPFAGATLLNPYATLGDTWQRANLHAHGRAWSGLTNGRRQSDEEIVRAYRSFGYSVAGVSDYHHIAADEGVPTLPIYEHGYNISKRHQLAIGARYVSWFDFPLGQTRSHQQFVIDQRRRVGGPRRARPPVLTRWIHAGGSGSAHQVSPDRSRQRAVPFRGSLGCRAVGGPRRLGARQRRYARPRAIPSGPRWPGR